MAVIQHFDMRGRPLGGPIDLANYVRAPVVGDLVWARAGAVGPATRMIVRGAEHASSLQNGVRVPTLALIVEPYLAKDGISGLGDDYVPIP